MAGLHLDPWQQFVLTHALGEREDGRWAAFEVGLVVGRQNGKGGLLEAREIAGLFLLGERLLVHTAHEFATVSEHFRRLLSLIEDTPDLDKRVQRVSKAHAEEGIELKGGQRIRFRTRTNVGTRGFTADFVALDEAMDLPEAAHGSLLPTLSARPNPQLWYTASAVDRRVHPNGGVLARIRERGIAGDDPTLAYFEWSVPQAAEAVTDAIASDRESWSQANPALGIRIRSEHLAAERASMSLRTFAVERLGAGDWPSADEESDRVISAEAWEACADPRSRLCDPVMALAFDLTPDRATVSIAAAGKNDADLWHVEIVEHKRGTRWLPDRLAELVKAYDVKAYVDAYGPAGSLVPELERAGLEVVALTTAEVAQACGLFYDAVVDGQLRHLGGEDLTVAVMGAAKRPLGDRWAWSRRKSSNADISPLVCSTIAVFAAQQYEPRRGGFVIDLNEVWAEKLAREAAERAASSA